MKLLPRNKDASRQKCGVDYANCDWSGDVWTRDAVDWIRGRANIRVPWFLYAILATPLFCNETCVLRLCVLVRTQVGTGQPSEPVQAHTAKETSTGVVWGRGSRAVPTYPNAPHATHSMGFPVGA